LLMLRHFTSDSQPRTGQAGQTGLRLRHRETKALGSIDKWWLDLIHACLIIYLFFIA
jgi:hypothetical protein